MNRYSCISFLYSTFCLWDSSITLFGIINYLFSLLNTILLFLKISPFIYPFHYCPFVQFPTWGCKEWCCYEYSITCLLDKYISIFLLCICPMSRIVELWVCLESTLVEEFSKVIIPIYIYTRSLWVFHLLHNPLNTCYFHFSHSKGAKETHQIF